MACYEMRKFSMSHFITLVIISCLAVNLPLSTMDMYVNPLDYYGRSFKGYHKINKSVKNGLI